jgi:Asp-tRNA(Asn)/Glu-tRNA(Gln) amidotransferase A subunit family amidase
MRTSLNKLSAVEIQAAVARSQITCEQVARACLDRVQTREPTVRAWAYFEPDRVLSQARQLDRATERGPLHGVPIGVKDVIDTFDMPTQMGSAIYRGYQPPADASCVALLRTAGALVFGKTVTCEFAGMTAAQTTNPHDASRSPGGSSSGSAAAVADFMVPLALGTQTGGSVQRPCAYCGVIGYVPTYGTINTVGVKPAAETLDTVGLMARAVEDIELARRVLTNAAPVAWLPSDATLRVGLCRTPLWETAEKSTQHALIDAGLRLASAGHSVHQVTLPAAFAELAQTREVINDYERARALAHEWRTRPDLISERLADCIRRGFAMEASRYVEALRHLDTCRQLLAPVWNEFDVLLAPTVIGEAPQALHYTGDHRFQSLWTQLRTPTVNLPTHTGPNGLPVGIQLIGRAYEDSRLLAAAQLIFRRLGHGPNTGTARPSEVK